MRRGRADGVEHVEVHTQDSHTQRQRRALELGPCLREGEK